MAHNFFPALLLLLATIGSNDYSSKTSTKQLVSIMEPDMETKIETVYNSIDKSTSNFPKIESFSQALEGFYGLKAKGKLTKDIITIIDFSLSSTTKRLWVIDLSTNTILLHSLVSHGINSGMEYATSFSNSQNSFKSSLGLYVTGEIYQGKNGLSLKLDGVEKGVNDRARDRGVVVHGAYYANPNILSTQNYLGRSQGCPAIPEKLNAKLINIIKDKSCLFIYHPSRQSKQLVALTS